ncbi:MAG: hypothetical protein FWH57_13220 [Oscillospiraceae bacterium]|nr:hypothetical protein [Oscillospiraceae bacterium]
MIAEKSPQIKQAVVRLLELSADEKARAVYEAREKERRDNLARERGAIAKGKQEGKQEEKIDVAKNALLMKMPIDDIIKLTGLTKGEVEALQ